MGNLYQLGNLIAVTNKTVFDNFKLQVDSGEASVIALAYEIDYDYLILDDLQARKFAEQQGLKIKGTLGVLLIAKLKGVIPLLSPYLERLQKTNFRISQKLIQQILHDAGE